MNTVAIYSYRLILAGLLAALMFAPSLRAQQAASTAPNEDSLAMAADTSARMTVVVRLGGTQTRNFIVDTGADRTVISSEIAAQLQLEPAKPVILHSMNGETRINTVILPELAIASSRLTNIHAPALPARYIGADGMLGVDSLKNKRIVIDFRKSEIIIAESAESEAIDDANVIVVRAKSRFGQLILVDADIEGRKIKVILDTGAQNSVGNSVLRKLTINQSSNKPPVPISLVGVTGEQSSADYSEINHIRVGSFMIHNMPVAFADVHPFKRFGLTRQPALLLGMDVLRKFDWVSIDFASRKIKFLIPRR